MMNNPKQTQRLQRNNWGLIIGLSFGIGTAAGVALNNHEVGVGITIAIFAVMFAGQQWNKRRRQDQ